MISPIVKELSILVGAFGFISREVSNNMQKYNLNLNNILNNDENHEMRLVVRLLQKLEINIKSKNHKKAEKYLQKSIEKVNDKLKINEFIDIVIGISLLQLYKEHYKNKRILKGISWNDVNTIYDIIEAGVTDKALLIKSQKITDELYKELLK